MEKALEWVSKRTVSDLKASFDGYENPSAYTNQSSNEDVRPDISFVKDGKRYHVDIALKSDEKRQLVSRWKILSVMATMKGGKLYLLAPKGHKMFAQKLVANHQIEAIIQSI